MAERRMFSRSIVTSDAFLDMPAEAQALYLQLNMAADDDGFVDNPRTIMRSCGASNDSMKLLRAKKFVLTFGPDDNFIVVIKHWRVNNYIRSDRYRETRYKELMREMYYDENRSYSMNPGDGHVPCLPPGIPSDNHADTNGIPSDNHVVGNMETQDSIGEYKDKESIVVNKGECNKGDSKGGNDSDPTCMDEDTQEKQRLFKYYSDMLKFYTQGELFDKIPDLKKRAAEKGVYL